jgi:15-hydroxyprostaglandin dehydrogenase (NAD)
MNLPFTSANWPQVIVNNAGITEMVPLYKDPEASWKKVIDIDLTAVILGI